MKIYGSGRIAPFLTLALECPSGTHWIGGWVNPGSGLDAMEKRKILPLPGIVVIKIFICLVLMCAIFFPLIASWLSRWQELNQYDKVDTIIFICLFVQFLLHRI
jgi:hypothetical protein